MLPTDNGVIPSATVISFLAHCSFNLIANPRTMDFNIRFLSISQPINDDIPILLVVQECMITGEFKVFHRHHS
jgi:hypothetical protein